MNALSKRKKLLESKWCLKQLKNLTNKALKGAIVVSGGKNLVDNGEYEPYNFEEEEMDEEDYYSEDD